MVKKWESVALLAAIVGVLVFTTFPAVVGDLFLPKAEDENLLMVVIRARALELGGFDPDEVVVTQGERVRLSIYSEDVVHGIRIAGYELKAELLPGKWTELEFTAENVGEFPFLCTIYCSPFHGLMRGKLKVILVS
jgi:cytochrome c oxidase subunit 2